MTMGTSSRLGQSKERNLYRSSGLNKNQTNSNIIELKEKTRLSVAELKEKK